jgi:uncharacterized protein (UPF0335 family)
MKLDFPTETKARQEAIEKFVEGYMNSHEPGTFVKDEHGDYMYSAGSVSLNLKVFFENLIDAFINENESKKPEIGDKVKVLCEIHGHGFDIGDIVTIIAIDEDVQEFDYECSKEGKKETWFLTEEEFEVIG